MKLIYDEESQSWKSYEEPYKTIECQTEAAYQFLVDALEHYKKHGRWVWDPETMRCSVCNQEGLFDIGWRIQKSKYCPHCGAKMDGDIADEQTE